MDILAQLGATDDSDFDIFEAALLVSALDHPGCRLGPYRAHLDDIVADAEDVCGGQILPVHRAEALARAIAFNHGYAGDRETYEDATNANIIDVIDRRRGLPVALAIIYLAVARRLGWSADGLNMPGHFLIRVGDETNYILQDPFADGALIASGALPPAFQAMASSSPRAQNETAECVTDRAVVVRLLNNLARRAEANGDMDRALIIHQRMTGLAPQYSHLWWERARLERSVGHLSAARTSLIDMLETTHDPALTARASDMLAELARSVN
jgi:regulator of sirC expression with transglutaminase-like and TPR domain